MNRNNVYCLGEKCYTEDMMGVAVCIGLCQSASQRKNLYHDTTRNTAIRIRYRNAKTEF